MSSASSPKGDGFRAPAEWEPHSACLIGWPWKKSIWQEPAKAQRAFLEVIRAICKAEKVIIIANPGKLLAGKLKLYPERLIAEVECSITFSMIWH